MHDGAPIPPTGAERRRLRVAVVTLLAALAGFGTALATTRLQTDAAPRAASSQPTAAFTYSPTAPVRNQTVTFDSSPSSGGLGTITSRSWDFTGDGRPDATTPVATTTFPALGPRPVTLTVRNDLGLSSTSTQTVTVRDAPPTASFTATPSAAQAGQAVSFDASASADPDGTVTDFRWDLDGDGTFETDTGTTPTATHVYTAGGTVTVGLQVTDDSGSQATAQRQVTVDATPDVPPAAAFSVPQNLQPGAVATFDAAASAGHGLHFAWDFGGAAVDGGTAPAATHGFPLPGDYVVRLTVTDDRGRSDTVQHTVHVLAPPGAILEVKPVLARPGRPVRLRISGAHGDDGSPVGLYLWRFGDGAKVPHEAAGLRVVGAEPTTDPQVTHVFAKPGLFHVVVDLLDARGGARRITTAVDVRSAAARGIATGARAHAALSAPGANPLKIAEHLAKAAPQTAPEMLPSLTASSLPATENPVLVTASIPDVCVTAPDAGGGPESALLARVHGDAAINPDPGELQASLGDIATAEVSGAPTVTAFASKTTKCTKLATFRPLKISWGDGTQEPLSGPYGSAASFVHTYHANGQSPPCKPCNVRLTVEVGQLPDKAHPDGVATSQATVTLPLDVAVSYCGALQVGGVSATVATGGDPSAPSCWVPSGLGYASPTQAMSVGGVLVSGDKGLFVSGHPPGQPAPPDDGTFTAGFGKLTVVAGGATFHPSATALHVGAGSPHVVSGLAGGGTTVQGLQVAKADLLVDDGAAPRLQLVFRLPALFTQDDGAPATTGAVDVTADQAGDSTAAFDVAAPDFALPGGLGVDGLQLHHDADGWHGGMKLDLLPGVLPSIDAHDDVANRSGAGVLNTGETYFGATLNFPPPQPTFAGLLTLQSIGVGGSVHPTRFQGSVTASGAGLFSITGSFAAIWPTGSGLHVDTFCEPGHPFDDPKGAPPPFTFRLCGSVALFDRFPLADGFVQYQGGSVAFGGTTGFSFGDGAVSIDGGIDGSFTDVSHWEAHAGIHVCEHLIGDSCLGGDAWLTPVGAAACVDLRLASVGGYVRWSPFDWDYFLHGCGARAPGHIGAASLLADPLRVLAGRAPGASLAAVRTARVGAGEPWHVFEVIGAGGPPLATLTSPDGKRVFKATGALTQCLQLDGAARGCAHPIRDNGILRSDRLRATVFYVKDPQPGQWKIGEQPGSPAIATIRDAAGTDVPDLRGAVHRGPGGALVLDYQGALGPGVSVTLAEQDAAGRQAGAARRAGHGGAGAPAGAGTVRVLGHAARAGTHALRFRPSAALGPRRRIVALVSVDGSPWRTVTLARYAVPRPPRARAPRGLMARFTRAGLDVRWRAVPGAARYLVSVGTAGASRQATVRAPRTHVLLRGLRPQDGATVAVRELGADGRPSPTVARVTLAARPVAVPFSLGPA